MKKTIESIIELFDVPSGSILGLFTLVIIGMSVSAFMQRIEIPASVISAWQFAVGAFAGSKAVKTVWGKPVNDTPPEAPKA